MLLLSVLLGGLRRWHSEFYLNLKKKKSRGLVEVVQIILTSELTRGSALGQEEGRVPGSAASLPRLVLVEGLTSQLPSAHSSWPLRSSEGVTSAAPLSCWLHLSLKHTVPALGPLSTRESHIIISNWANDLTFYVSSYCSCL